MLVSIPKISVVKSKTTWNSSFFLLFNLLVKVLKRMWMHCCTEIFWFSVLLIFCDSSTKFMVELAFSQLESLKKELSVCMSTSFLVSISVELTCSSAGWSGWGIMGGPPIPSFLSLLHCHWVITERLSDLPGLS